MVELSNENLLEEKYVGFGLVYFIMLPTETLRCR